MRSWRRWPQESPWWPATFLGTATWLSPDQTGYLAAVGQSPTFARWTNQISDDAALARRLGWLRQAAAGGEFSVEAMVGRYVELYEELMSAGR